MKAKSIPVPTSEEFISVFGQVSWLATLSKDHRNQPIGFLEAYLSVPLMFKQVRVYKRDKQPLAAVIWAYVSKDIKKNLEGGDYRMGFKDWRSGPHIVVVDCISPFTDKSRFIDEFLSEAQASIPKTEQAPLEP